MPEVVAVSGLCEFPEYNQLSRNIAGQPCDINTKVRNENMISIVNMIIW